MTRQVTVTADDYGITRRASDAMLDAARAGRLDRVSILPNGLAFDHAVARLAECSGLGVSIHLNLTEGKALADPKDIPHLAYPDGTFRHTSFGLLCASIMHGPKVREEAEHEIRLQVARVRERLGRPLSIDGHQHVHMVPAVFSVLAALHAESKFLNVRLPREPFFIARRAPFVYVSGKVIRHLALNLLSRKNRPAAARAGMSTPDFFIGTLLSGQLTAAAIRSALEEANRRGADRIEIGVHPGRSTLEELDGWRGDTQWYTSLWRDRELQLLSDPAFRQALAVFAQGTLRKGGLLLKIFRFGIVGFIATAVSLGVLYGLTEYAGVWYLLSAVIAYALGIGVSFTLQKFWTFSHRSLERTGREVFLYVLNTVFCIALNAGGLYLLVEYLGAWYITGEIIMIALISVWSFFVYRFVIFKAN